MRASLKAIRQALLRRRHDRIPEVGGWLRRVVQGYFNYHDVPGNIQRLGAFRTEVARAWLHALRWLGQPGPMPWSDSGASLVATSLGNGCFTRTRPSASRRDTRQSRMQ